MKKRNIYPSQCLAFSVELYIKYLHYTITREATRGNNILELFKKLPERSQQEIFNYPSIVKYGWSFSEFKGQIQTISDGFEK
jgi:HEPN domain-containing protein